SKLPSPLTRMIFQILLVLLKFLVELQAELARGRVQPFGVPSAVSLLKPLLVHLHPRVCVLWPPVLAGNEYRTWIALVHRLRPPLLSGLPRSAPLLLTSTACTLRRARLIVSVCALLIFN